MSRKYKLYNFGDFNSLFENVFVDTFEDWSESFNNILTSKYIPYETEETENEVKLVFEVPGVIKEQISLAVDGKEIQLKVTKNVKGKEVTFDKKFTVKDCDLENTKGTLKNGLLTLSIPKVKMGNKKVQINVTDI